VKTLIITSDMIYGHTDSIILKHLMDRDSYGYEINKTILEKSNNNFELKEATLYTAFRRLEKEGYISSYWGDSNAGARRRYYTISDRGREYFQKRMIEWQETKKLLDILFSD